MNTINTKKELFLGKRKFEALKLSQDEFCKMLEKEIIYFLENYNEKTKEMCKVYEIDSYALNITPDNANNHIEMLYALCHCYIGRGPDPYVNDLIVNDIAGSGAETMNWNDYLNQGQMTTLENGFTFVKIYSSVGDDALLPIYNIFYFNKEGRLTYYVPYCGNLVFVGADVQMCAFGGYGYEDKATQELCREYNVELDDSEYRAKRIVNLFKERDFFELYARKYGGHIDDLIDMEDLEFDEDLMIEDILSNVQLVEKG